MTNADTPFELRLATTGLAALCWMVGPVTAQESKGRESAIVARPTLVCADRPQGVRPPPRRLAPIPRPTEKGRNTGEEVEAPASVLGTKAPCPEGKVPVIKARSSKVEKGNPLLGPDPGREILKFEGERRAEFIRRSARSFEDVYRAAKPKRDRTPPPAPPAAPACNGVPYYGSCYYYASAGFATIADGAGMRLSIEKPQYVNTGGSGHSLNELAVQGGSGNGNIVEIGWLVSTEQYGNANPHIFVFHWKNWAPTCYDACGWVQWSSAYHPGMDLGSAVGKRVYVGYVLFQGDWWAWFDNQWMGYFPGSEWGGNFTKTSLLQWFGEVASANGIPPRTDMGTGRLPPAPRAARMTRLCDVDANAWVCWYRDRQSLAETIASYYDIRRFAFGAVRYGGPGE